MKRMMIFFTGRRAAIFAAALLAFGPSTGANAAEVTVNTSITVTDCILYGTATTCPYSIGDEISLIFTYDDADIVSNELIISPNVLKDPTSFVWENNYPNAPTVRDETNMPAWKLQFSGGVLSTIRICNAIGCGTGNNQDFSVQTFWSVFSCSNSFNGTRLLGGVGTARYEVKGQLDYAPPGCGGVSDSDGDGVDDDNDNCPEDPNPNQDDLDMDGIGDACDNDADGDGEFTPIDCNDGDPSINTSAVEMCMDGVDNDCDTYVDYDDADCDTDGDGVPDEIDNCPNVPNPSQANIDGDHFGDACDDDDDNDTFLDTVDNCPKVANMDQADLDNDGFGDACDDDRDGDGVVNDDDLCASTTADPAAGVPGRRLGKNRWVLYDGDTSFSTAGKNPTGRAFSTDDTGGCSCAQIIDACGYGKGHTKFGCSNSVMDWWTGLHDREGEPDYQCKAN